MTLSPGTRLGPYEILAPLGAGGMGEVYRARDARLDRDVAIKVLPEEFFEDRERRSRFGREAKALAAVHHPNIAAVFSFEEVSGRYLLVQELLQGQTLRLALADGPLPVRRALDIAVQVADALAAAHENGIVHRDVKPENVFLCPDGRVKLLDFGLARHDPSHRERDDTRSPTATALSTPGSVAGTVAYMSPEQARGSPVDLRSDQFSLGVVLYEMLAGRRAFRGASAAETLTSIIREEPEPLSQVEPPVPAPVQWIVERCLAKDPAERFESTRDLARDLAALRAHLSHGTSREVERIVPSRPRRSFGRWAPWALAAAALAVAVASTWVFARRHGAPATRLPGRVMLAVLPVEDLNGDPGQDYFGDGLTEELIAQLGGLNPARLGVIARTSAMLYRKTQKPIDQIGRELGVDYLLEGSVRREGGRVRITTQLIHVRDQTHLWAQSYERDLSGILAIQSEVSRKVADSLSIELLPSERARLGAGRPVNPEAHELCLKGRHHWNLRTAKDLLKATEYFRAATAADPSYALAWAGLGDSYALYPHYGVLEPRSSFPQARSAAEKALALDPALVEAETTIAFVTFYYDWDWAGAETRLKRILERRPDYAIARQWYAEYLSAMGRHDEALREIRRARVSDPLSPVLRVMEGWILYFARRYEEALESLQNAQPLEPDYPLVYSTLGRVYRAMGRYPEALAAYRRADELEGADSVSGRVALVLAASGKPDEARRLIAATADRHGAGMALLYLALGNKDDAMVCLERAYDERQVSLVQAKVGPWFDPLRAEPRFQDLVRRMNFP